MIDPQIGNYRIGRQLGVGGMGAVYEGPHDPIGRVLDSEDICAHKGTGPVSPKEPE